MSVCLNSLRAPLFNISFNAAAKTNKPQPFPRSFRQKAFPCLSVTLGASEQRLCGLPQVFKSLSLRPHATPLGLESICPVGWLVWRGLGECYWVLLHTFTTEDVRTALDLDIHGMWRVGLWSLSWEFYIVFQCETMQLTAWGWTS